MSRQAKNLKMGSRIRAYRKGRNLKGYEFAKLIHISQGSLSDIENNKSMPSAATLRYLSLWTNIDVLWVINGVESEGGRSVVVEHKPGCHVCREIWNLLVDKYLHKEEGS